MAMEYFEGLFQNTCQETEDNHQNYTLYSCLQPSLERPSHLLNFLEGRSVVFL